MTRRTVSIALHYIAAATMAIAGYLALQQFGPALALRLAELANLNRQLAAAENALRLLVGATPELPAIAIVAAAM